MSYAGVWKRFAAWFIELFVLGIASALVGMPLGMGMGMDTHGHYGYAHGAGNLLGIVAFWIYFAAMESSSRQATLGKMALGIKVTDLNGNRISFGRATGRYFGKFVSSLIFSIGFIMAAFTRRKQALHDMMAGCLVVNKFTPAPEGPQPLRDPEPREPM